MKDASHHFRTNLGSKSSVLRIEPASNVRVGPSLSINSIYIYFNKTIVLHL